MFSISARSAMARLSDFPPHVPHMSTGLELLRFVTMTPNDCLLEFAASNDQRQSKRSVSDADCSSCCAPIRNCDVGRDLVNDFARDVMINILLFLRLPEMPAAWRTSSSMKLYGGEDQLWRSLYARRCWEGLRKKQAQVPWSCDDMRWRSRYRRSWDAQSELVSPAIKRLMELVPGVRGPLSLHIGVVDDVYRDAACCGLRSNPIVADNFDAAVACMKRIRELHDAADPQHFVDRMPHPTEVVIVTLEPDRNDDELDGKLARLRSFGGTCKPLLDCLCFQPDSALRADGLVAALRKVIGATTVCGGVGEAERVIMAEHCDVICCRGQRLAEYREFALPEIVWREWPSGEEIWEP